ncbi:MAG: peptide deformylase [Bacillota bacterium]
MALLNIREIGDPVLRTKAKKVEEITDKTLNLIDDMIKTMQYNDGIGLAAPQVGMSRRIIVIQEDEESEPFEMINPEITFREGKKVAEEGCLSIPEKRGLVSRAEQIKVEGLNRKNEEISYTVSGLLARVFQHEIDHLDGILFTDKLFEVGETEKTKLM